jgi:PDZ domain
MKKSSLPTIPAVEDESSSSPADAFRDESSTAYAEPIPIEDFQDCSDYNMDLDDSNIPTIRLSHLSSTLAQDFEAVQKEFGKDDDDTATGEGAEGASVADSMDHGDLVPTVQRKGDESQEVRDVSPTPTSSEDIMFEEDRPPQRQRLVSANGVIAEFELPSSFHHRNSSRRDAKNAGSDDLAHAKIVTEAVEIDASAHSGSFNMHDLELGDEEPLPYPRLTRRPSNLARAARNAISSLTYPRSNSTSSRSPFLRLTSPGQHRRAELLSATVIKNSPTDHVGLNLLRDEVVVYSINRDIVATDDDDDDQYNATGGSLLRHCPFQPGDVILSINNKRTQNMDSQEAARMLREATGFITIVCRNPDGDPCMIETMITKANKNQRSGMGLKSSGNRDLRVSSINENGLFAQSLLNIGDRVLSINEFDVTELDARVACDIIREAPDRVTLVARTAHTTGVVVAEVSARGLDQPSQRILTVVPEGEPDGGRPRNEIEAVDDSWESTRRQRDRLLAMVCAILVVVAISVFLSQVNRQ